MTTTDPILHLHSDIASAVLYLRLAERLAQGLVVAGGAVLDRSAAMRLVNDLGLILKAIEVATTGNEIEEAFRAAQDDDGPEGGQSP